jgi:hypothetical protein
LTRVVSDPFATSMGVRTMAPHSVQGIEDQSVPLRVERPIPPNERKRLQVLRDLRLVQNEMDGVPVGDGFEFHRNEIVRTILRVLAATLPTFTDSGGLQVVGNQDSYTINGDHAPLAVIPRSQVPCQHVMCLHDADKSKLFVDGLTCHDVLAINLRTRHKDLTANFCYPAETKSYVGAAIRISGVTIGSLCMASPRTIEELMWDDEKSKYLRTVASVLEEQLTRLCVQWKVQNHSTDIDVDDLIAQAHWEE